MAYGLPGALIVLLAAAGAGAAGADPAFRDVTAASGLDFRHDNGAAGRKNYWEVMGGGAALLDYDGDGRLDVYCVTSVGPNRLYRNLGGLRFEEVPDAAGAAGEGTVPGTAPGAHGPSYPMGATAADVDNDGDPDLFVTDFHEDTLWRNDGGVFRRHDAGLPGPAWSSGASFCDWNRDGLLDLYVVRYVQVAVPDTNVCPMPDGHRLYCGPRRYPRERDALLRNVGGARFEDVSEEAGVLAVQGRGLGVVALDYDRDGWSDFYVANDLDPNFLFQNRGDGTFEEVGILAGVSHSEDGAEESGMGIAAGDYDRDGWIDLFVTNYVNETNTIYHNERNGFFLDETASTGLGAVSLPWISWGTHFLDWDLDGWPDLFVANGHTESEPELVDPTTTWKQPDLLFRNRGDGTFEEVTAEVAPALLEHRAGRGVAFGDLDDDGDTDVVVINQRGPALLLENTRGGGRWIGFRTEGTRSNRDGVGARVELHVGGRVLAQERQAGSSYLSSGDPRVLFGLGDDGTPDSVVVEWPSGDPDVFLSPEPGRYHVLREGEGVR